MISMNQIIQDAPFGIRGMGNNIQFLTQQFTQLRAGGMSVTEILSGMLKNTMTPMGALMLGTSIATSALTVAFDSMRSKTSDVKDELKKLNEELIDSQLQLLKTFESLTRLPFESVMAMKKARRVVAQEKLDQLAKEATKDVEVFVERRLVGTGEGAYYENVTRIDKVFQETAEYRKAFKEVVDLDVEIANYYDAEMKRREKIAEKDIYNDPQLRARILESGIVKLRGAGLAGFGKDVSLGNEFEEKTSVYSNLLTTYSGKSLQEQSDDYVKMMDKRMKSYNRQAKERKDAEDRQIKETKENLRQAMNAYNSLFFDPLRAGFQAVRDGSKSFAEAFNEALTQMIQKLAEFAIYAGILSIIFPSGGNFLTYFKNISGLSSLATKTEADTQSANGGMLTEPIFGVGRSGRTYSFVEDGKPEYVMSNRQLMNGFGARNPMQKIEVTVKGVAKGDQLHYVMNSFKAKKNAMRIG
jgi:uncharacterized protein YukE